MVGILTAEDFFDDVQTENLSIRYDHEIIQYLHRHEKTGCNGKLHYSLFQFPLKNTVHLPQNYSPLFAK